MFITAVISVGAIVLRNMNGDGAIGTEAKHQAANSNFLPDDQKRNRRQVILPTRDDSLDSACRSLYELMSTVGCEGDGLALCQEFLPDDPIEIVFFYPYGDGIDHMASLFETEKADRTEKQTPFEYANIKTFGDFVNRVLSASESFLMGSQSGFSREAQILHHDFPPDQMFLNDPLGIFRGDVLVPGAFGIDHRDRAGGADAEALAFGAEERPILPRDVQLLHSLLSEILPRALLAGFGGDTIRADADKQMARQLADAEGFGNLGGGDLIGVCHQYSKIGTGAV